MQNGSNFTVKRPVRRRGSKLIRNTLFGTVAIIALVLGVVVGTFYFTSSTVRQTVKVIFHRGLAPEKAFPGQNEVNVLILGRDVDLNNKGQKVDTNGRTDTVILAHFNFANKAVNLLSIPRDTKVRIPGYRGQHKINAAHAFGGPELTCATVENLLTVCPEEYIVVDYDGFVKLIDELGGIHITVDKKLDYDDNWGGLHIHLKPGPQKLDGYQAMGYVRYRKSNDGCGDTDAERIARQHVFLAALRSKILSSENFFKLPKVVDSVHGHVNGTLTMDQMMSLAYFVKSLPRQNIRMETLPSDEGRVYVTARENETRHLVQELFY